MFRRVYLDNSATTPVDKEVVEAMIPFLTEKFGNASSIHFFGQEARAAVDNARHQVAEIINARPNEIVFTSGGTESNNLAIRGLVEANDKYGKHIITSQIEHPAVKEVCEDLEKNGFEVTYLPVYEDGIVKIEDVKNAVREDTILISIMTANNEIGTIQPVEEIGKFVGELKKGGKKIWFHTDAVQAIGKIPTDVEEIGCDLLSISAHKIYAPKGIGALYIRRGVRLHTQNIGGHQERERRGGTESVAHIVAFGKACEIAKKNLAENTVYLKNLRDKFESEVGEKIDEFIFNGRRENRLPQYLEHFISIYRRRRASDKSRYAGHRRFDRLGVQFGKFRTLADHPRARTQLTNSPAARSVSVSERKIRWKTSNICWKFCPKQLKI